MKNENKILKNIEKKVKLKKINILRNEIKILKKNRLEYWNYRINRFFERKIILRIAFKFSFIKL